MKPKSINTVVTEVTLASVQQLDTLGTSRGKDIPSACQGAIVIRFEFWS